eukprot:350318-Chlamydomonas_euryale.AAC.25
MPLVTADLDTRVLHRDKAGAAATPACGSAVRLTCRSVQARKCSTLAARAAGASKWAVRCALALSTGGCRPRQPLR